jgi:hypothetical protein
MRLEAELLILSAAARPINAGDQAAALQAGLASSATR